MTNQIQTAQTINTVVEQTSAVMETQHRINKHLISDETVTATWGLYSRVWFPYQWPQTAAVHSDLAPLLVATAVEATTWISTNMAQMTVDDMVLKVVFLLQMGTGLLANTYLLFIHSSVLFTEHKPKPTDLILSNVAMANSFVLLSKGIQQIMEDMGLVHALEEPQNYELLFLDSGNVQPDCWSMDEHLSPLRSLSPPFTVFHKNLDLDLGQVLFNLETKQVPNPQINWRQPQKIKVVTMQKLTEKGEPKSNGYIYIPAPASMA
ncbi:hypothetical protein STEG23_007036 [Scotinomys teguina]